MPPPLLLGSIKSLLSCDVINFKKRVIVSIAQLIPTSQVKSPTSKQFYNTRLCKGFALQYFHFYCVYRCILHNVTLTLPRKKRT